MLKWILPLALLILPVMAREYVVFSVAQDFPMSPTDQTMKKNFYVNIGSTQGIRKDTILDVFRIISRIDPYGTTKRFNYRVPVGQLKVIHSEDNSAIAILHEFEDKEDSPYLETRNVMIGDHVSVHVAD